MQAFGEENNFSGNLFCCGGIFISSLDMQISSLKTCISSLKIHISRLEIKTVFGKAASFAPVSANPRAFPDNYNFWSEIRRTMRVLLCAPLVSRYTCL